MFCFKFGLELLRFGCHLLIFELARKIVGRHTWITFWTPGTEKGKKNVKNSPLFFSSSRFLQTRVPALAWHLKPFSFLNDFITIATVRIFLKKISYQISGPSKKWVLPGFHKLTFRFPFVEDLTDLLPSCAHLDQFPLSICEFS